MEENQKIMEFNEDLTLEDLQIANYFNFRRQKKYLLNQIIFIAMSLLCTVFSVVEQKWWLTAVGGFLVIFSVFLFLPFYKKLIYSAVKRNINETLNVYLAFSEDSFIYTVVDDNQEVIPYEYNKIVKMYDLPEYIYLYFYNSAIAIIKKDSCKNQEELIDLLKSKLDDKYEKINKMPK